MDIKSNWPEIRNHFNRSFRTNFHVAIASVDTDNNPTVTPIGSLFLNKNCDGFYFEKYPRKLREHAEHNKNICILAVNSGRWFWIKSLFRGKFKTYPGIKLYGVLGDQREATKIEIAKLNRRMQATRWLKGNHYLWGSMTYVRDIQFNKVEKINLDAMTKEL